MNRRTFLQGDIRFRGSEAFSGIVQTRMSGPKAANRLETEPGVLENAKLYDTEYRDQAAAVDFRFPAFEGSIAEEQTTLDPWITSQG